MSFSADIEQFVLKSEKRLEGVIKESIKNVVNTTQIEVKNGGKMRDRKTNFLRASARASTEGFPSGPSIRPKDAQLDSFTYDGEAIIAVINDMKLGETFYFGWTADYAAIRESHDGFLETAAQNWQQFVNANSERFRGK